MLVSSNNHASPSGALPFLLPAALNSSTSLDSAPVSSNRIQRWARDMSGFEKGKENAEDHGRTVAGAGKSATVSEATPNMRYEAYMALLDHRIRNAYVGASFRIRTS